MYFLCNFSKKTHENAVQTCNKIYRYCVEVTSEHATSSKAVKIKFREQTKMQKKMNMLTNSMSRFDAKSLRT